MSTRRTRQLKAREDAYQRHALYVRLHGTGTGEEIWNRSYGYDVPHEYGLTRTEIDRRRMALVRQRARSLKRTRHAYTR